MSIHKLLTHANEPLGHILGKQFEDDFTESAVASGLSDEQAKSAFNANMLESGVLTEGPAQFGRTHNRRWLVSDFEAGDVVLHNTYMVGLSSTTDSCRVDNFGCFYLFTLNRQIHASTVNHDSNNVIRLATDLRFVDSSRPWDKVRLKYLCSPSTLS
jgi:hypothetical protein